MRVILDVLEGPLKGRSFVFERHDTFIVGRSRFVHCPMPEDMALSRDHFMIEINPPLCELRDLGSTNGTFVNNHRVDRVRLVSGDVIAAGQSVFRVQVESAQALSSGEGTSEEHSGTETIPTGQVRCAGCGALAPPNLTIVGPGAGSSGEKVEWWCALCRSEAARAAPAGSVLHDPARAGPGCHGRGLPGAAQPDRPDGRSQADHARDGHHPRRDRSLPARDLGHQPTAPPQYRRAVTSRA